MPFCPNYSLFSQNNARNVLVYENASILDKMSIPGQPPGCPILLYV